MNGISRQLVTMMICVLAVLSNLSPTALLANETSLGAEVLTEQEWESVDTSVAKGLEWLADQQHKNGSFPTVPQGQPGVTSLGVLAFLSHGHLPGEGPYGQVLEDAIDYIQSCQKTSGLLSLVAPRNTELTRNVSVHIGGPISYNHAISSLALSEVYSLQGTQQAKEIQAIVERSVEVSLVMQKWDKPRREDIGGWRYIHPFPRRIDSDLSVTGWYLMSLRSAKNAGFDVPQQPIDDAVEYVRRCYRKDYGVFNYSATREDRRSRAMGGAGVLALAHAGFHNSEEAQAAGDWVLEHNFDRYNQIERFNQRSPYKDRYHYSVFNCSQAMYQLGGRHWQEFYPRTVQTLVENQRSNGSWAPEGNRDGVFGSAYTTSLVLLAMAAPNQLLPIFQR